jgi:DNA-3-methyladenine glycosylase II
MLSENKEVLSKLDTVLYDIMHKVPALHIETTNDVFHDLMSCVIEQQIHHRSTKKIFQKMMDTANLERLSPDILIAG